MLNSGEFRCTSSVLSPGVCVQRTNTHKNILICKHILWCCWIDLNDNFPLFTRISVRSCIEILGTRFVLAEWWKTWTRWLVSTYNQHSVPQCTKKDIEHVGTNRWSLVLEGNRVNVAWSVSWKPFNFKDTTLPSVESHCSFHDHSCELFWNIHYLLFKLYDDCRVCGIWTLLPAGCCSPLAGDSLSGWDHLGTSHISGAWRQTSGTDAKPACPSMNDSARMHDKTSHILLYICWWHW